MAPFAKYGDYFLLLETLSALVCWKRCCSMLTISGFFFFKNLPLCRQTWEYWYLCCNRIYRGLIWLESFEVWGNFVAYTTGPRSLWPCPRPYDRALLGWALFWQPCSSLRFFLVSLHVNRNLSLARFSFNWLPLIIKERNGSGKLQNNVYCSKISITWKSI